MAPGRMSCEATNRPRSVRGVISTVCRDPKTTGLLACSAAAQTRATHHVEPPFNSTIHLVATIRREMRVLLVRAGMPGR